MMSFWQGEPLGLPAGSVRALLAFGILMLAAYLSLTLGENPSIEYVALVDKWTTLASDVVFAYLGYRVGKGK